MNVLWVSPFLPNPGAGHAGGQAVYRWMSSLAARHAITLACRVEPHETPHVDLLRPLVRAVHLLPFARPAPGLLQAFRIAASYVRLARLASRLVEDGDFDLVHIDWLETGLGLPRRRRVPRVAVAIDELSKPARRRFEVAEGSWRRAAAWLTWRASIAVQRRVCHGYDAVLTMSEQDRQALLAVDRGLRTTVVPFPVVIEGGRPDDARRDRNHLLFVGAMNRDVNIAAVTHVCRDILPLVRREYPDVRFTIAGAAPPVEVRALASEAGVEVTGFVPDLAGPRSSCRRCASAAASSRRTSTRWRPAVPW
jgi:glycosyltransferase involved in cell wall biosynthesis